ncbi:hypothetical protein SAMN05444673_6362 [Bacillus sp. OV166]|uniref:hypothetical protein n=1 Tax=Bacillus sp. OV166 TaxID=1882763 RepID=UPI000A2ACB7D|nr:hypothetical protein [Bacillus sp. OV166]SMQ85058.1 hypothetical protein SAMN05444673_6362 [Bacillus sp. OV166]
MPNEPDGLKAVRNSLEHFENRLDEWSAKSKRHISITIIGAKADVIKVDGDDSDMKYWRVFNSDKFTLFNDTVSISEVCKWVKNINKIVNY